MGKELNNQQGEEANLHSKESHLAMHLALAPELNASGRSRATSVYHASSAIPSFCSLHEAKCEGSKLRLCLWLCDALEITRENSL